MDILGKLLLQVILIALNAFFACAEIAMLSVNDARIAQLTAQGDKRAVRLSKLTKQPATFLATIQVAITFSGFFGSAFAANNFASMLTDTLISWGVPATARGAINTVSVIIITLILSYLTLVFGELVPKRLAMKKAESIALGISAIILFIARLFSPIVWLLTKSTNLVLRMCRVDPDSNEEDMSEDDIKLMVDEGTRQGVIDSEEKEIIHNLFEFDDKPVGEFATHRMDLTVLWLEDTAEEWDRIITDTRHSVYPVCGETIDDVIGVLSVKDYYRIKDKTKENIISEAIKPAFFVPESVYADVLFRQMKEARNHFAVVLDEYGGVAGIVTMNDLLAQIVGNFSDDEEDGEEELPPVTDNGDGSYTVQGTAELREVSEALGTALPTEEYDTFGGYVFGLYGSVPTDGSSFEVETDDLTIQVKSVVSHRVTSALVRKKIREESEENAEESGRDKKEKRDSAADKKEKRSQTEE